MIAVAMDPKDVRKVAAFAEAIREVETRFGYRLDSHEDGLLVGGDAVPVNLPYVLVRVPVTEDLAVGVRAEAIPAKGRPERDYCELPACGCDGTAHP